MIHDCRGLILTTWHQPLLTRGEAEGFTECICVPREELADPACVVRKSYTEVVAFELSLSPCGRAQLREEVGRMGKCGKGLSSACLEAWGGGARRAVGMVSALARIFRLR